MCRCKAAIAVVTMVVKGNSLKGEQKRVVHVCAPSSNMFMDSGNVVLIIIILFPKTFHFLFALTLL